MNGRVQCVSPTDSVSKNQSGTAGTPFAKRAHWPQNSLAVLIVVSALFLSACTEDKAKALRLTAENFKTEADTACAMGLAGLRQMVAMPPATRGEIAKQIATAAAFGAPQLAQIYAGEGMVDSASAPARDALSKACEAHRQLAAIYTDLPSAYLLATPEVVRAQKHVVNVTARFTKLTLVFNSLPDLGKDNPARIKIIEATIRARALADQSARIVLLDSLAGDILELQNKERATRSEIFAQFAKAVDLGATLMQASMDYDTLSVGDLLQALQEHAALYGDITGRTAIAQNAIARVTKVQDRIKNDPRLKVLLDADIYNP